MADFEQTETGQFFKARAISIESRSRCTLTKYPTVGRKFLFTGKQPIAKANISTQQISPALLAAAPVKSLDTWAARFLPIIWLAGYATGKFLVYRLPIWYRHRYIGRRIETAANSILRRATDQTRHSVFVFTRSVIQVSLQRKSKIAAVKCDKCLLIKSCKGNWNY